ncbi:MAG: amidohydrolase family protein [Firmicutes bacterium]|nr:amidohydrolase family protein [Bacillota bacterium]NBI62484.1 hypothetical protein [Clostridiales bacterium]
MEKQIADIILKNGKFYLGSASGGRKGEQSVFAEAAAIQGRTFLFAGTSEECLAFQGLGTVVIDLRGRVVLPGLLDGHTHPVTIAKTIWYATLPMSDNKKELLENIKKTAEAHPKEEMPYFYAEGYAAELFGSEGPKKELLDTVISDRPARIQDFTDHACWYNSMAIDMLGIRDGSGQVGSPAGEATFIRDENGEPTGWTLEAGPDSDYGIYEALGWQPPTGTEEESVKPFLDFLKDKGITGLMDGFTEGEAAMELFYNLDEKGQLNMYYEGASLMRNDQDLERSIRDLRTWQQKYTTEHVRINTVKIFVDGTNEMGNSASLEPLKNDAAGENYGAINIEEDQLTKVFLRLNSEKIDAHLHVVCDRGFRVCCNAVERAQNICHEKGQAWDIYVTLAHCELIHPEDMARVTKLGLFIDWTAHWAGGYFGEAAIEYLGKERWDTMYDFTKILADGGKVGISSDVFSYSEAYRANPYFGIQTSMTRVDIKYPLDAGRYPGSVRPPANAKLTLEQLLQGYTSNNACRMRLQERTGSIEAGKMANLVILDQDIFEIPVERIHEIDPEAVMFEGQWIKGGR